jgi:hypothetical protein
MLRGRVAEPRVAALLAASDGHAASPSDECSAAVIACTLAREREFGDINPAIRLRTKWTLRIFELCLQFGPRRRKGIVDPGLRQRWQDARRWNGCAKLG